MNGELRGGLLLGLGVFLGWLLFDGNGSAEPAPTDGRTPELIAAIQDLRESLEAGRNDDLLRQSSRPAQPERRPSAAAEEAAGTAELVEVLRQLGERLAATSQAGTFADPAARGSSPDLRAGIRIAHPNAVQDVIVDANASGQDLFTQLTERWILASPATIVAKFGQPKQVASDPSGETWIYEVLDPESGNEAQLNFRFSPFGYVAWAECSKLER